MLRLAIRIHGPATAAIAGLALASAGVHAAEPLLGGSPASFGSAAAAVPAILAEAQSPSLGERFGLPRSGSPAELGLPPAVFAAVLAKPPPKRRTRPRSGGPR